LIGAIDIHDDFTFVEVPREVGHEVLDAMRHASIQGHSIQIEPARLGKLRFYTRDSWAKEYLHLHRNTICHGALFGVLFLEARRHLSKPEMAILEISCIMNLTGSNRGINYLLVS